MTTSMSSHDKSIELMDVQHWGCPQSHSNVGSLMSEGQYFVKYYQRIALAVLQPGDELC